MTRGAAADGTAGSQCCYKAMRCPGWRNQSIPAWQRQHLGPRTPAGARPPAQPNPGTLKLLPSTQAQRMPACHGFSLAQSAQLQQKRSTSEHPPVHEALQVQVLQCQQYLGDVEPRLALGQALGAARVEQRVQLAAVAKLQQEVQVRVCGGKRGPAVAWQGVWGVRVQRASAGAGGRERRQRQPGARGRGDCRKCSCVSAGQEYSARPGRGRLRLEGGPGQQQRAGRIVRRGRGRTGPAPAQVL